MIQTHSSRGSSVAYFDSCVEGVVAPGHGIASGKTKDLRFPQGTIAPQIPHFAARGLNLESFFPGTLNVDIAPQGFSMGTPSHTFRDVQWHPEFKEHFSFCSVAIAVGHNVTGGFLYYPQPETKTEFMDGPTQLQILAPMIPDVKYGARVKIYFNSSEFRVSPLSD